MWQRRNRVTSPTARAAQLAVFALAATGVLASALRGWPAALYAQAPPPQTGISSTEPEENVAAFRRISNKMLCQCGSCSYNVLSCNHLDCSSATYIRRTIKEGLAQGKTEEVILAGFVEQYGPRVLNEPPRQGFAFLAWLMPFVALVLGAFGAMYALSRMRHKPAGELTTEDNVSGESAELGMEATPEMVEKYREQIERELRNS